jgi:hypothetical protein
LKGNKYKDYVKNGALFGVEEISDGMNKKSDGNNRNGEKQLKGDDRVNFLNEGPS